MEKNKQWTLMFYLASDNPLAPGIVSQLKSIKAAGFHRQANVIVQFDPQTENTPTHVFDVNGWRRAKEESGVGFKSDSPWVYNLLEDRLWCADDFDRKGVSIHKLVSKKYADYGYEPPLLPAQQEDELSPKDSLQAFVNFCAENYPANRYMLFILGHGLIVGTETFLYDEHADKTTLGLKDLGNILHTFKDTIDVHDGKLELVSFHSCSVSSVEVAYELKGSAHYMLASQGTAFIGSWPYRQILVRIFNSLVEREKSAKIEDMLRDIFNYCAHNSTDFLLAGYPFHLCLCDLKKVEAAKDAIDGLSAALTNAMLTEQSALMRALEVGENRPSRPFTDAVLLAHLESQSFHQELYTDIADFCRCLYVRTATPAANQDESVRTAIHDACCKVVEAIKNSKVLATFAGPEYQYAKGLSIYFPWSQPLDDIWQQYQDHSFNQPKEDQPKDAVTWARFLETYFATTMRVLEREHPIANLGEKKAPNRDELLEDQIAFVYSQAPLQARQSVAGSLQKGDSTEPTGDESSCPSIKNYPRDTRPRKERKNLNNRKIPRPVPIVGGNAFALQTGHATEAGGEAN